MSLPCEYLPATGTALGELVLLHGWGCNREIWRPLLAQLRPWANVTLLDLPGCAPGCVPGCSPGETAQGLDAVLEGILACSPERAVYAGWSLGGQLAVELARRQPGRVSGLVTICSNPRFIASADWSGMDEDDFHDFRKGVAADPETALKRFHTLQVTGANESRRLLRQLRQLVPGGASPDLLSGLQWLESLDQREALRTLAQPQLHLLGELDGLVPSAVGQAIADADGRPSVKVSLLENLGHVALLEAPAELARELQLFMTLAGDPQPGSAEPAPALKVTKDDIAASFSRAAAQYDSAAHLQREVGEQLLSRLGQWSLTPQTVLDLGCGTGYFQAALQARYPDARYIGLDLARGMVEYARARVVEKSGEKGGEGCTWLVGDAEALPLASESVDLVFSSLAVQWCDRPGHLLAELARVLRPGGVCVFTSLGPDTLQELRDAWAAADSYQHVNTFLPESALRDTAAALPGIELVLEQRGFVLEYERVKDLFGELKAIGAHNMNRKRPAGLASRRALQGMLEAYESHRSGGMLPATYDVIFAALEKS